MDDPVMDDTINHDWMFQPGLMTSCLDNYLKDIQDILCMQYIDRMSNLHPIIDDFLQLDVSEDKTCVPVEFIVSQISKQEAVQYQEEPQYHSRNITEFEEVLANEIFQDVPLCAQEYQSNKLIVVSGAGGQGKTTQLYNLAVDWSEQRSHILSDYNLLFYVPLNVNMKHMEFSCFEDMICEGYNIIPRDQKLKLKHLLNTYRDGTKVLILFDDYEGISNTNCIINAVINGEMFPNATVVVSGRPFWMKNFQCGRDPDVMVDIVGLTEDGVSSLFHILLDNDENAISRLEDNCNQYVFDRTLLRIPLFATMCCYIFLTACDNNVDQCSVPTTTTQLFSCMLMMFLRVFSQKIGRTFPVHFNRSPLIDTESDIPVDVKRFIYQLSKMSFQGIIQHKYVFSHNDLKEFMMDPDEVCHSGIMMYTSKPHTTSVSNGHCCFSFRHKMFQEYMAGLYLSKETSAWTDIIHSFRAQEVDFSDDISDDLGYQSGGSSKHVKSTQIPKVKCKWNVKSLLAHLKHSRIKSAELDETLPKSTSDETNEKFTRKEQHSRVPTEGICPEFSQGDIAEPHYSPPFKSCIDLREHGHFHAATVRPTNRRHPNLCHRPVTVKKCLFNLLAPMQNTVMFACGAKPSFTKKVLSDCSRFASRKVCKWNNNKYDVGYEAVLYCEAQDPSLADDFFKFFFSLNEKSPSFIQFPRPYDEVATVHLAQDISNIQAENLLQKWYNLNLENEYLHGANIIKSDASFIEMSDPCLFEVLLLHKFKHHGINKIKATGNYFPGFYRISCSFPNLAELIFDGVNIPSLPNVEYVPDRAPFLTKLSKLHLLNVRASYPICPELQELFTSCSLDTLCLVRVHCDHSELFNHIMTMSNLDRLMLSQMGLSFEELVHGSSQLSCEYGNETELKLTDVLRELSQLTSLDLTDNSIGIALTGIIHTLQKHSLMELVLKKCRINSSTFTHCGPMLQTFQHICHLDVGCNPVQESLGYLIHCLGNCPDLQALGLRKCNLKPTSFKEAAIGFQHLKKVTRLDISDNSLGSATKDIFENLPTSLQELFIENCCIQSTDAINGSKSLRRLVNLCRLDIQDNPIHGGIVTIVRSLKRNKTIEILHMQKCRIMPKHFQWILPDIAALPRLSDLGIGKNTCCDSRTDARNDLVKYLCQCKKLEKLQCCVLFGKSLEHYQADRLRKKIKETTIYRVEH